MNWHHRIICAYLDKFVAGEIKRLMIFMPPQNGKSELVSRRLPAYIFGREPDAAIIASSYGTDLAQRMNRDVQRIMDSPEYGRLFPDTRLYGANIRTVATGTWLRNSDIFEIVDHKGSYRGAGRGAGITGMGFNYGIIDDPFADREEGKSPTIRENVWEWYTSTFYTRQRKNASILITQTRWHELDLSGRLIDLAKSNPEADQWVILSFPAIAEAEHHPEDPREEGEPLWANRYPLDFLLRTKAQSPYEFAALFQQRPAPAEGGLLKREWFTQIVHAVPAQAKRVRYWDKAGSKNANAAWTAGVLMAYHEGIFYIEDIVRGRWEAPEREKVIKQTAELDAQKYGRFGVKIWQEQEPGSGGKESAQNTVKNLAGFIINTEKPVTNKDARLDPFASQAEAGNVRLKYASEWNPLFVEEAAAIPFGSYRDMTDAAGGAFNKLSEPTAKVSVGTHTGYRRPRKQRSYVGFR